MSLSDTTVELIDRYLNGEMSEGERTAFEARLETDQEFAELFEIHYVSYQIVVGKSLLDLKARMEKDLSGSNYSGDKNNGWKFIGGGAVLLLMSLLTYFFLKPETQNEPKTVENPVVTDSVSVFPETNEVDTLAMEVVPEMVPETAEEKPATVSDSQVSCKDTLISFSCQARAACSDQNNGAIEVDVKTIKYGKAPFEFSVYADRDFISEPFIGDLKQGKYNLFVRDARGCVRRLNVKVEVPSIDCQ
jgi:hypothetical protein